jgi:hypothetical protein
LKKNILRSLLFLFIAFISFSFWNSPSLGGLLPIGKESPDKKIEELQFTLESKVNYKLKYPLKSNESHLKKLKTVYRLDTLINQEMSDFEKVRRIQNWVQSRWKHDGNNRPEKSNAMFILKEAEKGKRFRCVEYSIVANECLSSLGFRTRNLGLMTKDVSDVRSGAGHAVNEVYLPDLQKWMYIDPQFGVVTINDGLPLNAVELQACIIQNIDFEFLCANNSISKSEYIDWIGPYLYYFYVNINGQSISVMDRIVGTKKQLTLLSKTANPPSHFQNLFRYNNSFFTHSTKDFYPKLTKNGVNK